MSNTQAQVKGLTITSKDVFGILDVTASYTLVLPSAHFANGTAETIEQKCTCEIVFYSDGDTPYLNSHRRLVKIAKPERFGKFDTTAERLQYVENYVTDTGAGIAI